LMWYNISTYVGIFFVLSTGVAVILIRTAIRPLDRLDGEEAAN